MCYGYVFKLPQRYGHFSYPPNISTCCATQQPIVLLQNILFSPLKGRKAPIILQSRPKHCTLLNKIKAYIARSLAQRRNAPCDYRSSPTNFILNNCLLPSFLLPSGYLLIPVIVRSVFDRCSIGVRLVFDPTVRQSMPDQYRINSRTGADVRRRRRRKGGEEKRGGRPHQLESASE